MVSIPRDVTRAPEAFVVPRDHAAAGTHIAHTDWLTTPGKTKRERKAKMDRARVVTSVFESYRDRWDLLDQPSTECPIMLQKHFRKLAEGERVGLPYGHPWRQHMPPWR